jgi:ribonuclease HII
MKRAFMALTVEPDYAHVDGKYYPELSCQGKSIIQGDSLLDEISAASILAKVSRDDEMLMLEQLYPGYGFAQHKGYPTKLHLQYLQERGITPHHRKTFSPVAKLLSKC